MIKEKKQKLKHLEGNKLRIKLNQTPRVKDTDKDQWSQLINSRNETPVVKGKFKNSQKTLEKKNPFSYAQEEPEGAQVSATNQNEPTDESDEEPDYAAATSSHLSKMLNNTIKFSTALRGTDISKTPTTEKKKKIAKNKP